MNPWLRWQTASPSPIVLSDNRPPVAHGQVLGILRDGATPVRLTGSDPDGDPLTFEIVSGPERGHLIGAPPTLDYTAALGSTDPVTFTFRVSDGRSVSEPATILFQIFEVSRSIRFTPTVIPLGPNMSERITLTRNGVNLPATTEGLEWRLQGPGHWNPATQTYTAPDTIPEPTETRLFLADWTESRGLIIPFHLLPAREGDFFDPFDGPLSPDWAFVDYRRETGPDFASFPGWLTILAPRFANLWPPKNQDAPRLLRAYRGDFEAETFVRPTLRPDRQRGTGGILLWIDQKNYVRLNHGVHYANQILLEKQEKDNFQALYETQSGQAGVWLRLARRGPTLTAYFRESDGGIWQYAGEAHFGSLPETVLVGVYSLDPEVADRVPFEVSFDSFRIRQVTPLSAAGAWIQGYAVEAYRGRKVNVPIFLSPQANGVIGGSLSFSIPEGGANGPRVTRIARSPLLGVKSFEARENGVDFIMNAPAKGPAPFLYVEAFFPSTLTEPRGVSPIPMEIRGQLQTETGMREVQMRLDLIAFVNRRFGDLNGDDSLDLRDVILALRAVVGLESLAPEQQYYGDVAPRLRPNDPAPVELTGRMGDGRISTADVVTLLQRIVGLNVGWWPDN
ncbi:MAG: DUF1349 domain-containing protein [Armatimonadetes bacterium]|nr:DUF1349 domain-containing protein [Armatimonadota bacterium]